MRDQCMFRVYETLNNFSFVFFFFLFVGGKCLQYNKALVALCCSLSLSREREKRRELKAAAFVCCCSFYLLNSFQSASKERESMKASSSIEETDDASPLSEQQKQRTLGELRFRFRSSALKQSPSSDALLHDGEEEDFLEDQLARYVEPPELPTLAMHKVFGTFLLEAFSYMRNV